MCMRTRTQHCNYFPLFSLDSILENRQFLQFLTSILPGLNNASSRSSLRFVMPTTSTFWRFTSPSILLRICSAASREKRAAQHPEKQSTGIERGGREGLCVTAVVYSRNLLPIINSRLYTETCGHSRRVLPPSALLASYLRLYLVADTYVCIFTSSHSIYTAVDLHQIAQLACNVNMSSHASRSAFVISPNCAAACSALCAFLASHFTQGLQLLMEKNSKIT